MKFQTNPGQVIGERISPRKPVKKPAAPYPIDGFDRYVASRRVYLMVKRSFDIMFSLIMIVCVLSWLLPVLAVWINFDSRGPVLFRQKRLGRNGKPFVCLKLRTMFVNLEADEIQAVENDIRVTRAGRFLRRTNLDELPQFWNVLMGDMSVVGPRPHMISDCTRFSFVIPAYARRHLVKPGITGWAQAKGFSGPAPGYERIAKRYEWDARYVDQASLWLDLRILSLTLIRSIPTRQVHPKE